MLDSTAMTNAMSNAIIEYAKLAGQLDSKTNQLNQSLKLNTSLPTTTNLLTTKQHQQQNNNKRKREFTSINNIELKGISNGNSSNSETMNLINSTLNKSIENGFLKLDKSEIDSTKDRKENLITIKERICLEKKKAADYEKERHAADGDLGKLSDLKLKNDDLMIEDDCELLTNGNQHNLQNSILLLDDCKLLQNGSDLNHNLVVGEINKNGIDINLQNGDELEDADEYRTNLDDCSEKGGKQNENEQNFNNFYNVNLINENHHRIRFNHSRLNSKRMLIKNRSKQEVVGKQNALSMDYSSSINNRKSSSSNSANGNGSDNMTVPLSLANGNDSCTFEDNLADENRCSSTTSVNSGSNNGLNLNGNATTPNSILKYHHLLPPTNLQKNSKLLNDSNLSMNEMQEDGNIVISSRCVPATSNSFSVNRAISANELSNNSSDNNQSITGSKFTTPALCCIVCGDASSGKHYGIQVKFF